MNGPQVLSLGPQVTSRGLYLLLWWVEQELRTQRLLRDSSLLDGIQRGQSGSPSLLSRIGFNIKVEEEGRQERKVEGVESPELKLARDPGIQSQLCILFLCELRRGVLCSMLHSLLCKTGRLKTLLQF